MLIDDFEKASGENYTINVTYVDRLPGSAVPASIVLAARSMNDGQTASVVGSPSVSGILGLVPVLGGTDGVDYWIDITTTLSEGTTLQDHAIMRIRDRKI